MTDFGEVAAEEVACEGAGAGEATLAAAGAGFVGVLGAAAGWPVLAGCVTGATGVAVFTAGVDTLFLGGSGFAAALAASYTSEMRSWATTCGREVFAKTDSNASHASTTR